ncbi:Disease resistance protein L6 [Linum perenne]
MDQQRWPFICSLAALSLAVAVFFLPKRRPGISNGTSPSQSESPAENQPSTASTSSNSALPVEYEVFLSFRGSDVRANFADVLYTFLDRFKIRTFLDSEELPKGETIAPSLEKAIKESKVYIPILSQDYASSKWCLKELAQMVKCCKQGDDRIILPIFYMMEPRDVRHQEGSYKKAFQLYSKKYDAETIKEWKEALKEVFRNSDSRTAKSECYAGEAARQLLLSRPQLPKALFQSENLVREVAAADAGGSRRSFLTSVGRGKKKVLWKPRSAVRAGRKFQFRRTAALAESLGQANVVADKVRWGAQKENVQNIKEMAEDFL